MSMNDFRYLLGAMIDVEDPDRTDPLDVVAGRRLREKMAAKQRKG